MLRKVLGTENPADMMTKYLDRTCIDKCMGYLSQDRADGRAKSGLEVQGADPAGSARATPAESYGVRSTVGLYPARSTQGRSDPSWNSYPDRTSTRRSGDDGPANSSTVVGAHSMNSDGNYSQSSD